MTVVFGLQPEFLLNNSKEQNGMPIITPSWFVYSKSKVESDSNKASPCLRPFFTGNMLKICLPRLNYRFHLNMFLLIRKSWH